MNNVQQTSRIAYREEIKPTLGIRQEATLYALRRLGPSTNKEVSRWLELEINSITPRMYELVKKGLVREWGTRLCKITGRRCIAWCVNDGEVQLNIL